MGKRIRIKFLEWVFNREAKRSILILRGLRSGRFDGVVSQANSFSSNVPEVAFSSSFSAKPCRDVAKFNSNRARIGEEADLLLEQIAAYLIDHPEFAVLVYGHSDITGSAEHNWDLGARRAQAMVFSRDG
ncbi:MAG: OmpA family protein [Candidatus Synoicihabitans palmerolidicus]|nr:OmpA family protein [Candidatus Synoicihabitans palmerolidicus]